MVQRLSHVRGVRHVRLHDRILTHDKKRLLLDVIANWSEMGDADTAAKPRAEIATSLDSTVIA